MPPLSHAERIALGRRRGLGKGGVRRVVARQGWFSSVGIVKLRLTLQRKIRHFLTSVAWLVARVVLDLRDAGLRWGSNAACLLIYNFFI